MVCKDDETTALLRLSDMGDSYIVLCIFALKGPDESGRRRIVLIGSSSALLFHLIRSGYQVLYIDKDSAEIEDKRRVVVENLSEDELARFQSAAIDVEEETIGLKPDDIVCFVRSLHHSRNPSETIRKIYRQVRNVVVCDTCEDLLQEAKEIHEKEYAEARTLWANDVTFLEALTTQQCSDNEVNQQCLRLLRQHCLKDEEAVKAFLNRSGFDLADVDLQFCYRPRCPCGNQSCWSVCTYWFLVAENCALYTP